MKITHITFEGLTGVGKVELDLDEEQRVFALIGTNGVGKTKCLEALFLWRFLSNQAVQKSFSTITNQVFAKRLISQVTRDNEQVFVSKLMAGSEDRSKISEVVVRTQLHTRPVIFLGAKARANIDKPVVQVGILGNFEERQKTYWNEILKKINDSNMASIGMQSNISEWFVLRAQSANPYQKAGDNRKIEIDTLLRLLHRVDTRVDPAFLEIDGTNQVAIKVNAVVTRLQHLSSGFTSLLKMLQAIVAGFANFTNEVNLTNVPGIVLIDEIESHLHVSWQAKIIPLLKELFPKTTFYVATHSPVVLSQLQEGEAYLLNREVDGVVRSRMIDGPNRKAIFDVLNDGLGLNLNQLKIERTTPKTQVEAKRRMLDLLRGVEGGQ